MNNCENCDFNFNGVCGNESSVMYTEAIEVISEQSCSKYTPRQKREPFEKPFYVMQTRNLEKVATCYSSNEKEVDTICGAIKTEHWDVYAYKTDKGWDIYRSWRDGDGK